MSRGGEGEGVDTRFLIDDYHHELPRILGMVETPGRADIVQDLVEIHPQDVPSVVLLSLAGNRGRGDVTEFEGLAVVYHPG